MTELSAHQFSFDMPDGSVLSLSNLEGKVVLVVNTASHCGFTPQYEELQTLYDRYRDQGFEVIAVPSGDFGGQEFGTDDEVKAFTDEKFTLNFPITTISKVSGDEAHPFYQWANDQAGFIGSPKWNFHKYLIGKEGQFVSWYSSMTTPTAKRITVAIEAALQGETDLGQ
ncbi:MAG: glutathione peroxidase [Rickettsiales bacterium]|nr:glutathione peroxidase [Rickettsiales bacterium]